MFFTPRFYRSVRRTSCMLFFIYIGLLIYLLFLSPAFGRTQQTEHNYNLIPWKTIGNFIKYRAFVSTEVLIVNIIGNVVAFIPMGILVPLVFRKQRSLIKVILASANLSLLAEIFQYVFRVGSFDVDDVGLNTMGGVLGYLLFSSFYGLYYMVKMKKRKTL